MPRFDGTGPFGAGAGAGWGRGPCGAGLGFRQPARAGGGFGRGFGLRRWGYGPSITKKEEKEILENEVTNLEDELKVIKARLAELKK